MKSGEFLYLTREEVESACHFINPMEVISDVLSLHAKGETMLPDEAYLSWKNGLGDQLRSLNMPSYIGGKYNACGTKIINANPNNPSLGLPRASGATILFDVDTAQISCIMEGAYISSLRTATVSALAVKLLVADDMRSVSIIGAGVQARMHLNLLHKYFELQDAYVFDTDQSRLLSLIAESADIGLRIHSMLTAEETVRQSKLIIPLTTTTSGYIEFNWLQPGSLLVNVSLDDPLAEVAMECDKLFVDDWSLVRSDHRRLLGRMYRQGLITASGDEQTKGRKINGELGELINGDVVGRESNDEKILVNPFGLSIEDIGIAFHVYQVAKAKRLGTVLCR